MNAALHDTPRRVARMRREAAKSAARWWALAVVLISIAAALVALDALPTELALPVLLAFVALGPGGAVRAWLPMTPAVAALAIPATGAGTVLLVTTGVAMSAVWLPTATLAVIAGVTGMVGAVRLLLIGVPRPTGISIKQLRIQVDPFPSALVVVSVIVSSVTFPELRDMSASPFGLLVAGSPWFPISITLAVVAFGIAIARRSRAVAWAALIALVVATRGATVFATDLPPYAWTYKHLGVIDYIQVNGGLDREVDIYHSWPGVFAGMAWVGDVTGVQVLTLSHWFTLAFGATLCVTVFALARVAGASRDVGLIAACLAHIVNWIGQDYTSPQAVVFLLGIAVVGLVLASRRDPRLAWIALVVFAGITVSHQLTPYWLISAFAGLTVLGLMRPYWMLLAFIAVAGAQLALNFDVVSGFGSLFEPRLDNVSTVARGVGSVGHTVTALAGRAVTAALWVLSALLLLIRFVRQPRLRRRLLGLGVLAFSPLSLLLAQDYGGEAIFRVTLYSIPGCALIIAPVLARWIVGRGLRRSPAPMVRLITTAGAVVSLSAVTLASSQAYYGGWFANRVEQDSYDATRATLANADQRSLLVGTGPGAPGRSVARYAEFVRQNKLFDTPIDQWPGWMGSRFDREVVDQLTSDFLWEGRPVTVMITAQMKRHSDFYGTFPPGALDRLESELLANDDWRLITRTDTLTVLELRRSGWE